MAMASQQLSTYTHPESSSDGVYADALKSIPKSHLSKDTSYHVHRIVRPETPRGSLLLLPLPATAAPARPKAHDT